MPLFVTHNSASHRAAVPTAVHLARQHDRAPEADAYRRRLAALRTRAPDALRDRVRRELRAAALAVSIAARE